MYRQFGYVNRKKITLNRSKRLLYNKSFNRTANIPVKYRYYYLKLQRRKWPIFLSDIDKFKVSTSKETCVGTCHSINNMSRTIFFSKHLKTTHCGFHFSLQTTFIAKLRTVFFSLKKRTQFSNIFKFKTYYY